MLNKKPAEEKAAPPVKAPEEAQAPAKAKPKRDSNRKLPSAGGSYIRTANGALDPAEPIGADEKTEA